MYDLFDFMFDRRLTAVTRRDFAELERLEPEEHPKAVMLLSGSIIEGILCDALIADGEWTFDQAVKKNLIDLIGPAVNNGILREEYLSQAARCSRNLIHPGLEVRDDILFNSSDASISKHSVEIVIRDASTWAKRFRWKAKIRSRLSSLTGPEKELISLFSQDPPNDGTGFDHPRLSSEAYHSVQQLCIDELITHANGQNYTEIITLQSGIAELIDETFVDRPTKRTTVTLTLRNIDASGASGSGATGSYRR